ncbi:MAG: hypothetical protein O3C21_15705 [Verrucomicrobia bacterium]|nr:hypothetical protein [Verrucomicrobiota bacterium]
MDLRIADVNLSPTVSAGKSMEDLKLTFSRWQEVAVTLEEKANEIEDGDGRRITATLVSQMAVLDAMFHDALRQGMAQNHSPAWAALFFQVGLRAQACGVRTSLALEKIRQSRAIERPLLKSAEPQSKADAEPPSEREGEEIPNLVRLAKTEAPGTDGEELVARG